MDEMKTETLRIHSVPLWQMMLNASAKEMTCRAPRGIIGLKYLSANNNNVFYIAM